MAIIVREVADSEILRSCEIEAAAYKNDSLSPIIAPGPFASDSLEQRSQQLIDKRKEDSTARYNQAVDEESGRMVAFAKWNIYATEAAAAASFRPLTFGQGWNQEACMAFFGGMAERKMALMGNKPHIYLHMLHTDPECQGRGAGTLLLAHIIEESEKLGLPLYLESSSAGHKLYSKHGFEDIEMLHVDFTQWGGAEHVQPLMIRTPTRQAC